MNNIWEPPEREANEAKFETALNQLREIYPRLDFIYDRIGTLDDDKDLYTEENLAIYLRSEDDSSQNLALEIMRMKNTYGGIAAEDAYKLYAKRTDVLSATTTVSMLDLFTIDGEDFLQLEDDRRMMYSVVADVFKIAKGCGAKIYSKIDEKISDFEITIVDVNIEINTFAEEFFPQDEGSRNIGITDQLVFIFE